MSPLYLRNAETSVKSFVDFESDDVLIVESAMAVDCLDCEALLDAGIQSFRVILRADMVLRTAILDGKLKLDRLDDLILGLLNKWLEPLAKARMWVSRCNQNGYVLDNITEFEACVAEVNAIVGYDPDREMSAAFCNLRDMAVREHLNGQTVEFLSEEE